jgi:hypothetical protein
MAPSNRNKWLGGFGTFEIPVSALPEGLLAQRGIVPWGLTLSTEIGIEVVLLLIQDDETCAELEGVEIVRMNLKTGLCQTSFGPVFWLLFQLLDPARPGEFITFEYPVNLSDGQIVTALQDLAAQDYWHLFLLDPTGQVRKFVEFRNSFELGRGLEASLGYLAANPGLRFDAARSEYERLYSIEDLLDAPS